MTDITEFPIPTIRATAAQVEYGNRSVQDKLDDVDDVLETRNDSGNITHLATESSAYNNQKAPLLSDRLVSKALTASGRYYHFGIMDRMPNGELILAFRDGDTHVAEGDDGRLVYSKTLPNGTWSAPTLIAEEAGKDYRAAAGGTLRNGRIVWACNLKNTDVDGHWDDVLFFASDDNGETWYETERITATNTNYKIPFGKVTHLKDKSIIPYYERDPATAFIKLRAFESTDGTDWVEGFTVVNSAIDYNEAEFCDLGGGNILCITRVGGGGNFRQFRSSNGGATWADNGDVLFDRESNEVGNTLVSPCLHKLTNNSGTEFVIILYANRTTSQMRWRYLKVADILNGGMSWNFGGATYSAPTLSGYPSIVKHEGKLLCNFFRETALETESGAVQFEIAGGDLPDYEEGWFAVEPSTLYTKPHGLGRKPSRVEVTYSATSTGAQEAVVSNGYYNDGANKGAGAEVAFNDVNVLVSTGHALWGTGYFPALGTTARATTGFYKIRAWL